MYPSDICSNDFWFCTNGVTSKHMCMHGMVYDHEQQVQLYFGSSLWKKTQTIALLVAFGGDRLQCNRGGINVGYQ